MRKDRSCGWLFIYHLNTYVLNMKNASPGDTGGMIKFTSSLEQFRICFIKVQENYSITLEKEGEWESSAEIDGWRLNNKNCKFNRFVRKNGFGSRLKTQLMMISWMPLFSFLLPLILSHQRCLLNVNQSMTFFTKEVNSFINDERKSWSWPF